MYPYGLIGNCQVSALINTSGSMDWLCLPRPDSPPVFGKLIDPQGGAFEIASVTEFESSQRYWPNTTVLITEVWQKDGGKYRITDFCPRFQQHGRMYRPNAIFRIVEPVAGTPRIKINCQPVSGWDKKVPPQVRGNSHIGFEIRGEHLRLTTNYPLTYLLENTSFSLQEPLYFALTWGFGLEDDLMKVSKEFLTQTINYWQKWVQHCSIPSQFQKETIRSALTLKLHCYEDTGAILAALTTSLPEEYGGNRNWDYRYCWLRDAYYVLSAFRNLGHYEEMEGFLKFFLNIAESNPVLSPVYALDQSRPIPEIEHKQWQGYYQSGPVRSGNQAAEHIQNDVYGEIFLALAPIYFDERFQHLRTPSHEKLLQQLMQSCIQSISSQDAGLWEARNNWQEHSFTNLMSWAALERGIRIKTSGFFQNLEINLEDHKLKAEIALLSAVKDSVLRNGPKDASLDSALLQLPLLHFPDSDINLNTIRAIQQQLQCDKEHPNSGFLYRYLRPDDFGKPKSAFLICSFWLISALARLGQKSEALMLMQQSLKAANQVGLLSEHFEPTSGKQLGNFPQAYSHVGLINAAFAVSPDWNSIL